MYDFTGDGDGDDGNEFDQSSFFDFDTEEDFFQLFDHSNITKEVPQVVPQNKEEVKEVIPKRKNGVLKTKHIGIFTVRKNFKKIQSIQRFLTTNTKEDELFVNLCNDKRFYINPHLAGFIPKTYWPSTNVYIGYLVVDFFQRKNNVNSRFPLKLYNALQITKYFPTLKWFTGVEWVSKDILLVNKKQFARLLGIHSIDGSLFHHQGNFTTHGFIEVSDEEASIIAGKNIKRSDAENYKLLKHKDGIFIRSAAEEDICRCKWVKKTKTHPLK